MEWRLLHGQLQEHAARIPQNVKDQVQGDISSLNEAIVSEDCDKITEALDRLKNSSMEIGKAIYSQTDGDSSENQEEEQPQEENAEEAERADEEDKEKKEEEKK